jgi:predicted phosphoribosyltransferase
MRFSNRGEAGRVLAGRLTAFADRDDVLVLALPRGGVPVGCEVATILHVPLDVFVVRKLGLPGQPELAMGAIASGGVRVLNPEVVEYARVPASVIDAVATQELHELERRERQYRGDAPPLSIRGWTAVLVDDGLATGSTMRAAAAAVRQRHPAAVIVAVPVAPPSTCAALKADANIDDVVCVVTPEDFSAVGLWYEDFAQTSDDEVRDLLERTSRLHQSRRGPAPGREPR